MYFEDPKFIANRGPQFTVVAIGAIGIAAAALMIKEGIEDVDFIYYETTDIAEQLLINDLTKVRRAIVIGEVSDTNAELCIRVGRISKALKVLTIGMFLRAVDSNLSASFDQAFSEAFDSVALMSADCLGFAGHTGIQFLNLAVAGLAESLGPRGGTTIAHEDMEHVFTRKGRTFIGVGVGKGPDRASVAANAALTESGLHGLDLSKAGGAFFAVKGSDDVRKQTRLVLNTMFFEEHDCGLARVVADRLSLYSQIDGGNFGDELRVTVIVTGVDFAPTLSRC
jgi:cell division GTPase FtsZ